MEYVKKYWYLIPLALLVAYIAYVVLTAKARVASQMEKVREAKAEKAALKEFETPDENAG
jgi:hypothetical protein